MFQVPFFLYRPLFQVGIFVRICQKSVANFQSIYSNCQYPYAIIIDINSFMIDIKVSNNTTMMAAALNLEYRRSFLTVAPNIGKIHYHELMYIIYMHCESYNETIRFNRVLEYNQF